MNRSKKRDDIIREVCVEAEYIFSDLIDEKKPILREDRRFALSPSPLSLGERDWRRGGNGEWLEIESNIALNTYEVALRSE
ncbi:MAG: hypothetical protein R3220_07370 [Balneolaceae bacterium]|nr:hypothetical protein [Balneolaceae bacterium]